MSSNKEKVLFRHIFGTSRRTRKLMVDSMTLAFSYNDETGMVLVAGSRKSPEDNFNRKLGRKIAEGRLHKQKAILWQSNAEEMFKWPSVVQAFPAEELKGFIKDLYEICDSEPVNHGKPWFD